MSHETILSYTGSCMVPPGAPLPTRGINESFDACGLRSLLFQNEFSFFRRYLLLAVGTGNVTQRHRLRNWSKLPQRALSLSVGIGIRRSADEWPLASHRIDRSIQRMIYDLDWGNLIRQ